MTGGAQGRGALHRLEGGDEHRTEKLRVIGRELADAVQMRQRVVQTVGLRVEIGAQLRHVLAHEDRVQDRVLAAVPRVHHGPAVSGPTADLSGSRCLPAFFSMMSSAAARASLRLEISTRSGCLSPRLGGEGTLAY